MLPAARRIRNAADFQDITRRGRRITRGRVVVYIASSEADLPARAGVIVSSSVGGSVQRHRVARRIRAALSHRLDLLPVGSRVVVRALPGAATETQLPQQVLDGIDALRDRAG